MAKTQDYLFPSADPNVTGSGAFVDTNDPLSILRGYLDNNDLLSRYRESKNNALNWAAQLYQNQWNKDETLRAQDYNSEFSQLQRLLGLGMSKDAALAALSGTQATPAVAGTAGTGTAQAEDPLSQILNTAGSVANLASGVGSAGSSLLDFYRTSQQIRAEEKLNKYANNVYSWRRDGVYVDDYALFSPENFKDYCDNYAQYIDTDTIKRDKDGNVTSFEWKKGAKIIVGDKEIELNDAFKRPFLMVNGKEWRDDFLTGKDSVYMRRAFRREFAENVEPRGKTVLESKARAENDKAVIEYVDAALGNIGNQLNALTNAVMLGSFQARGLTILSPDWLSDYNNHATNSRDKHTPEVIPNRFGKPLASFSADDPLSIYNADGTLKDNAPLIMQNWSLELQNANNVAKAYRSAGVDIYEGIKENAALQKIAFQCQKTIMDMTEKATSKLDARITDKPFLESVLNFHLCCNALNFHPLDTASELLKLVK